jgi:hypothetical protein
MRTTTGGFSYPEPERIPFVLCQTLVRKIGGGDDNVIKHKTVAIEAANQANNNQRIFGSNHCIGTPAKVSKAFHLAMHLAGANTIGMQHIEAPLRQFMEDAVNHAVSSQNDFAAIDFLIDVRKKACNGNLTSNDISDIPEKTGLSVHQEKTLSRVLQATNMYAKETGKKSSYNKTHQLHMAALENIIYEDTGNCVQSSCKSGKDREGVLKNYRNAMRAFYDKYDVLPPSTNKNEPFPGARAEFVKLFVEFFKTHHQARLAELNAAGCQGQKALSNILPKDIMKQLKNDPEGQALLKTHKQNSALNDIGHSAVKADPVELERVKDTYSPKASNHALRPR